MCLWSNHMELEIENTEVVSSNNIQVEIPNTIEIEEGKKDYEVSVVKKEYTIIGDSIFIPSMYEDAPPWLKELIDTTINVAVTNRDQSLIDRMESILTLMDYVPKNQYTEQINQIVSEDGIINSRIATLNSNFVDAINTTNATIAEINLTYASKDEAAAIAINALTASLSADGEIGSALIQLQEAYADLESTTAQSISMLESVMEGEINGNATAMETIRTYVGIDKNGGSTGTGLLANVSILQKQNDGVIETVTGTYDVMLGIEDPNNNTDNDQLDVTKEPYKSWRDADAIVGGVENRAMHVGDVYIKYSASEHGYKTYERAYKFIRTSVDNTSPYSTDAEGFTWALIVDTDAQNAYVAALNALDLADNKRRVFTETPSGPYDKGDLWTKATARGSVLYKANTGRTSGFLATEWTEADDAALKDFEATVYEPKISMLETQIDSQINYFYNHVATTTTQVTTQLNTWKSTWTTPELKAAHHGDIGIFTKRGTEGEAYAYSRGTDSWILITDNAILKALMSAATAQATADGVVVSFYAIKQDTAPATTSLWLNKTGNKVLKKYTTSWVNVAVKVGDTLTAYDPTTKDTSVYVYDGTGWITNTENGIVAGSEAITTLTANLATTNTTVGGHTTQLSTVDTRIANGVASVETKWAYNSTVNINGIYKKSGFGLSTNYTSGNGTQANPYVSEFWIDASRFKFTNSNQTGQVAPFTIDATGTTPNISFNGIVNFANTNIANGYPGTVKINGGLLEANTVTANQINTTGLIAENISATEIVGKTITGGVINGARINGAVIKASYLDLNGELEVLTNYIITVAMYNANPSLYTDAVYISADNQYRIPTLSLVSEPFKSYTNLSMDSSVFGILRPYNSANVGHNLKAVKIRPVFQNTPAEFLILSTGYMYEYSAVAAALYVGNSLIGTFRCGIDMDGVGTNDGFFSFTGPYVNYSQDINNQNHTQVDITGIPVLGTVRCTGSIIDLGYTQWGEGDVTWNGAYYVWTMSLLGGDGGELPFNWTGERISIKRVSGTTGSYIEGGATASVRARLNGISINNMI